MIYVIFDTETTGFTGKDEVIQFSGVITDAEMKPIQMFDFYCDTARKSHPDALMTHRITQEELHKRSMGKTLEDHIHTMKEWFQREDVIWVGHNTSFDIRMINGSLSNNGAPTINFGEETTEPYQSKGVWYFDTMKYFKKKYPGKLSKLENALYTVTGFSQEQLNNIYEGMTKKTVKDMSFHRADFDSLMTWLLLVTMMVKGSE